MEIFKVETSTLAHYRVSSSSEVGTSEQITEGRGFKSHLELGFFSKLMFLP